MPEVEEDHSEPTIQSPEKSVGDFAQVLFKIGGMESVVKDASVFFHERIKNLQITGMPERDMENMNTIVSEFTAKDMNALRNVQVLHAVHTLSLALRVWIMEKSEQKKQASSPKG